MRRCTYACGRTCRRADGVARAHPVLDDLPRLQEAHVVSGTEYFTNRGGEAQVETIDRLEADGLDLGPQSI